MVVRVGAYVDGLNVYYGGRQLCGRSSPGWRWLNLAALVQRLIGRNRAWMGAGAEVTRIVYCTALTKHLHDPSEAERQRIYLRA